MKKMLLSLLAALTFSISAYAAVNLNTATQAELESLDGVGPVKAQAIIDYRKKNGGFKNVDELDNVPGFGDATMKNLKGSVSVNGKTTMSDPVTKTKNKKQEKTAKLEKATKAEDKPAKEVKSTTEEKSVKKVAKKDKKVSKADKKEAKTKSE